MVTRASLDHVVRVLAEKVKTEAEARRGADGLLKLDLPRKEDCVAKGPDYHLPF